MAQIFSKPAKIFYPESDGLPMAENTIQYRYIVLIKEGLEILFKDDPNIFIAGDLFWYPEEGNNKLRLAPDVMVVIGRPKGDRGSYQQWLENNLPPQIVFEIWSPGNKGPEKDNKFKFYERFGVREYYTFEPENGELKGWQRLKERLVPIDTMRGWVSPLLKIRFELESFDLKIFRPDDKPFVMPVELSEQVDRQTARAIYAEQYALETERKFKQEQAAKEQSEQKAKEAEERARQAEQRLAELMALLEKQKPDQ